MNVIDFHVTKILSEKYGKVYELYGMTLEKAQSHPKSLWREYLLSDGVLQEYEFWDYGGTRTEIQFVKEMKNHEVPMLRLVWDRKGK